VTVEHWCLHVDENGVVSLHVGELQVPWSAGYRHAPSLGCLVWVQEWCECITNMGMLICLMKWKKDIGVAVVHHGSGSDGAHPVCLQGRGCGAWVAFHSTLDGSGC